MACRIGEAGGTIITFPAATKNPFRIMSNAARLKRLVGDLGVDLVHARSRAPAWSALIGTRLATIPLVTTYHGAYAENGRVKRLYNSVMARADVVIANSAFTAALVRQRYGTADARIRVIHRGVDLEHLDAARIAPQAIARLRSDWEVAPGTRIILQAARLTSWKGQGVLIAAADRLHRAGRLDNAVVVLAGDAQGRDAYVDGLRKDVTRAGLEGRVRFVGHVDDMATALAAAHVTVIASTQAEAFGRTATEAQAMMCPVIATDLGAPRETVVTASGEGLGAATGWLVTPGDPDVLAQSIGEALALSDDDRKAIGRRARGHVAGRFTLEAMKSATLAVYDELLASDLAHRLASSRRASG